MKIGELFDNRYLLKKSVGEGAFGEVWLAIDQSVNVEVAIKIYIQIDKEGLEIFKEEFKTSFSLNHTNLLHANYCAICDGHPYIVMSYCKKGSLSSLTGKIESEKEIWKIIHDISSGLAYLHAHNIVHQDIKPQNILIDDDGNYLIADYGESFNIRSTLRQNTSKQIRNMAYGGSIPYMAPERFSSNNPPVMASDIWSLGATFYEVIEGQLPFAGEGGVMQLHGADIPEISSKWSSDLNNVVQKCLDSQPWDRIKAKELESLSLTFMKNPPVSKRGSAANPELGKIYTDSTQKKKRAGLIVILCTLLLCLVVMGLYSICWQKNPPKVESQYDGDIVNGKRHGWGVLTYGDSGKYEGNFRYDQCQGWGTRIYADKSIYKGQWNNNKRSGYGYYISSNGTIKCGIWENDSLDNRQRVGDQSKIVYGIDISRYQLAVDFGNVAIPINRSLQYVPEGDYLHPVLFVLIKATEGSDVIDPFFNSSFEAVRKHGISRGAYHILTSTSPVETQIEMYHKHVKLEHGDFPPILDLERESLKRWNRAEVIANTQNWLKEMENYYKAKPIIYCNEDVYNTYMANQGFHQYQFWIANPNRVPNTEWTLWQFSHTAKIKGTQDKVSVDLDKFNGSYRDFCEFIKMYGIQ